MGLEVKWYDAEQTILLATIAKDTTWDDYHASIDAILKLAASVNHRVDLVFLDDVGMPKGNPLPHLRNGIARLVKQPNLKLSLIAGSKGYAGFVRTVLEMVGRIFGNSTRGPGALFVPDLEEAVARIQADREKERAIPVTNV